MACTACLFYILICGLKPPTNFMPINFKSPNITDRPTLGGVFIQCINHLTKYETHLRRCCNYSNYKASPVEPLSSLKVREENPGGQILHPGLYDLNCFIVQRQDRE